jgi:hypothetical protein
MKAEHKPQYTIIRTEEFIQKAHELGKVYNRFTDLIKAIDWALERTPHMFVKLTNDFYLLKTAQLSNPNFPKLNILYRIVQAANNVILIDIDDDP